MPIKSKKQARTMAAACNDPAFAKKKGIPQDVACEFHQADKAKAHRAKAHRAKAHRAKDSRKKKGRRRK